MSITFQEIYETLIPHLGSCPKNAVMLELYLGAHEFFSASEVWTYDETQDIDANATDYTLSLPAGITIADIKRIDRVWYGEDSEDKYDAYLVSPDDYEFTYPDQLVFKTAYTTAVTDGLTTRIVLVSTVHDHKITNEMMDKWMLRGAGNYAGWKILSQDNKPWSDPAKAEQYHADYLRAVANAVRDKYNRGKSGSLRVVPRQFV